MSKEDEKCCPKFDPEPWDEKIIEWDNKKFIRDKVFTLFHIPVNFGKVITRMSEQVEKADAKMPDWLCLANHTSKWNMDLFLAVSKKIPGAANVELSGKYYSKVYEGPFKDTGKWCKDFEKSMISKKLKMDTMYQWYTTCPKCAKKYGKNYVVIIAKCS